MKLTIRRATNKDIPQIKELFITTVLTINKKDYTEEQVEYWAARGEQNIVWKERILKQYFIVALSEKTIVGFAAINPTGYLHSMFIHAGYQGKGIASLLLGKIEKHATQENIQEITADVSITARPFFEKKGYNTLEQQVVNIGVELINYKMRKHIAS